MFTPGHDGVHAQFSGIPLTYRQLMGARGWAALHLISPAKLPASRHGRCSHNHLTAENSEEKQLAQIWV